MTPSSRTSTRSKRSTEGKSTSGSSVSSGTTTPTTCSGSTRTSDPRRAKNSHASKDDGSVPPHFFTVAPFPHLWASDNRVVPTPASDDAFAAGKAKVDLGKVVRDTPRRHK